MCQHNPASDPVFRLIPLCGHQSQFHMAIRWSQQPQTCIFPAPNLEMDYLPQSFYSFRKYSHQPSLVPVGSVLKYHLTIGMQCPNWPGLITCSILEQGWSQWIVRSEGVSPGKAGSYSKGNGDRIQGYRASDVRPRL